MKHPSAAAQSLSWPTRAEDGPPWPRKPFLICCVEEAPSYPSLLSKKRTFLLRILMIQVPTLQSFWSLSEALYPTPEIMWKFLPRAGFKQLFRVQCEQAQVTETVAVTPHCRSLNINSASAPKANSAPWQLSIQGPSHSADLVNRAMQQQQISFPACFEELLWERTG